MPLDDRNYIRGRHPSSCTCVICVRKRLLRLLNSQAEKIKGTPQQSESPFDPKRVGYYKEEKNRRIRTSKQRKSSLSTILTLCILVVIAIGIYFYSNQANTPITTPNIGETPQISKIEPNKPPEITQVIPVKPSEVIQVTPIQPPEVIKITPVKPPIQIGYYYTNEQIEQQIYMLINNKRNKFGLTSLQYSNTLALLANEHSNSMANREMFTHDRIAGERDFDFGGLDWCNLNNF
ncbi:MAG TPA: hypothetical protein ENI23_02605 [bacterium]|nr:hypothetical protein [bacterium]